ncbi:uncharacterized protein LOC127836420 isoform X2 [Dreissena polymorpha]|uniref:uncharacterized protein LOC127836420 isoform X2 n=1 Tax=Dreissena polymorpha TaxID=45954 RepID=UPI002264CC07|nr:uncharacterized protein LOC127836420 isoform X2 [Dreissena polymorpha]
MSSHNLKKRKVSHQEDEHTSPCTENQGSRPRASREKTQQRLNKALRRIDTLEHELKVVRAEREVALTRLSAMMSVKLRDNNPNIADLSDPNIADLSDPNRPTNVAMMFNELYDNEWTDAYTVINSVLSERQTIKVLLDIVMSAYYFCSGVLGEAWQMMSEWYLDDSLPNRHYICKLLKDSRKAAVVKKTKRISEVQIFGAPSEGLCLPNIALYVIVRCFEELRHAERQTVSADVCKRPTSRHCLRRLLGRHACQYHIRIGCKQNLW